ncbi:MAG: SRPBCC family protein [Muribaculaceae bacterium]|nr:SRPBCC family protein [Muribaculaceae bacterium]
MAVYKSSGRAVFAPAAAVYNKLSDLNGLKGLIDNIPADVVPEDKQELLAGVRITSDSISFPAGPVGEITLRVAEKIEPSLISLEGVGTPVALNLRLELAGIAASECEAVVALDIAIPPMLKPMVGGSLQKMVDQFADIIERLKYE